MSTTNPRPVSPLKSNKRLLYRGSLSLPDSDLVLDGLTFSTQLSNERLGDPKSSNGVSLLQNDLALSLESMRGRPCLHLLGLKMMKDSWLDESGDVVVDIHPEAVLTRIYFENAFCLSPINAPNTKSATGVQIALGDSGVLEPAEIMIFARVLPGEDRLPSPIPSIILSVARVLKFAPVPSVRLPRPDDPTPRKPPLVLQRESELKRSSSLSLVKPSLVSRRHKGDASQISARGLMKTASTSSTTQPISGAAILGSGARFGVTKDDAFKVPSIPSRLRSTNETGRSSEEKALGGLETDSQFEEGDLNGASSPSESSNKTLVKKRTVQHLCSCSITKSHVEFKDIFGYIYRGVCFALRHEMKIIPLDKVVIDSLIEKHAQMYVPHREEG